MTHNNPHNKQTDRLLWCSIIVLLKLNISCSSSTRTNTNSRPSYNQHIAQNLSISGIEILTYRFLYRFFWHLTASPHGATTGQGGAGEKPCLHTRQLLMQRTWCAYRSTGSHLQEYIKTPVRGLKCTWAKAEKHLREVEKSIRPTEMSASRNKKNALP